mmetsp:Transcript_35911/g.86534  ORF Transcript_35911/g.86534 Transcript_35911/m.86534 type:complete len:80 (+) Transcript_35911:260-499(+)
MSLHSRPCQDKTRKDKTTFQDETLPGNSVGHHADSRLTFVRTQQDHGGGGGGGGHRRRTLKYFLFFVVDGHNKECKGLI